MLKKLILKNYRNIAELDQEISDGPNLIIASNGSGKTNIIESIHYSVFGNSFRPINSHSEIIGIKAESAKIISKWDHDTLDVIISKDAKNLNRNFLLNQKKYPIIKISQLFPLILFAPNSVDLITGEPVLRRQDLNEFISIISLDYSSLVSKYNIILKNRNALLKQIRDKKAKIEMLDYWTSQLILLSDKIFKIRYNYFLELEEYINLSINLLYPREKINHSYSVKYAPSIESNMNDFSSVLTKKFNDNKAKEIIVGKTLYGVHKDDYILLFNGNNLRFIGSRGQQRIGTLIMKIAQLEYYYRKFLKYPLLLLDDVMSELDENNRILTAEFLLNKKIQLIVTSAEEKEVPKIFKNSSHFISL